MKAIKKWTKDKSPLLALIGPQVASGVQDLHLLFRDTKNRRIFKYKFDLPVLSDWYQLYCSHRLANDFIKGLISEFSVYSQDSIAFGELLSDFNRPQYKSTYIEFREEWSRMEQVEKEKLFGEARSLWSTILSDSLRDIEEDINEIPFDPDQQETFMQKFTSPAGSFYFLIHVPCWLLYRQSPTRLYRKARLGDFDALDKLLRLDALMIHDPAIGKQVQKLRFKGSFHKYEALMEAVLKKPKNRITRKKMKYSAAGFISAFSHAIGQPIDAQEITDLFDAVAQDYHGRNSDDDIPNRVAFNKAIQRDRAYWLAVLPKDIKN